MVIGILFSYYIEENKSFINDNYLILGLFPEEIYFLSQIPSEITFGLYIYYFTYFLYL